ncbi:MAG TPA: TolC family protein [Candidatus Acidoferrales bacterium]|jgi:outer membrane protein|nr:TolC family protein [Candidatus Acidoferrales bacterium]
MAASFCQISILLLAFLQASFPLASSAQLPSQPPAVPSGTLQLTLKEAVQLALKQNPQRVIAQLLVSESDRNSQIARSPLLPQASMKADGAINQYNFQTIERSRARVTAGPYQYIEAGPAYSQSLLNLPLIRGYQIAREATHQARADDETTRENVVNAVVDQYLLILRALATRDAASARVTLAQRLYDQATELQKTGIGLNIDTVRANVELQNERQNLIDAETLTHTTEYGLAELLDLPRGQELEVADHLDFYDLPTLEKEALLNQALAARPEIRSLNSQKRIAHLSTDSASEQRLPQLEFSGFWYYQGSHFNNGIPAYSYELSLQFPIFTGGRIRAEEARAKLEEQHVAEIRRQVEARIVDEVKSALDELTAARNSVDVANLGLQLAQEEVAQAQRRFQAGVTTNVEVITAQDALARASDNQIGALYQFNLSRASLARATGEIEAMYSK